MTTMTTMPVRLAAAAASLMLVAATQPDAITYTYVSWDGYTIVTEVAAQLAGEAGIDLAPHGSVVFEPTRDRFVVMVDDFATVAGQPLIVRVSQWEGDTRVVDLHVCVLDGRPVTVEGIRATLPVSVWLLPSRRAAYGGSGAADCATSGATAGQLTIRR